MAVDFCDYFWGEKHDGFQVSSTVFGTRTMVPILYSRYRAVLRIRILIILGSWIRIRIRVKGRIRIRIIVKNRILIRIEVTKGHFWSIGGTKPGKK